MSEEVTRSVESGEVFVGVEDRMNEASMASNGWQSGSSELKNQGASQMEEHEETRMKVESVRDEMVASEEDDSTSSVEREGEVVSSTVDMEEGSVTSARRNEEMRGATHGEKGDTVESGVVVPFTPLTLAPPTLAQASSLLNNIQAPQTVQIPSAASGDEDHDMPPPPTLSAALRLSDTSTSASSALSSTNDEEPPPRLPDLPDMPVFRPSAYVIRSPKKHQ